MVPLQDELATESHDAAEQPPAAPDAEVHLPSLDGLRALGVSMVLSFHVGEWFEDPAGSPVVRFLWRATSIGAIGVDLFFVLSGFLITGILLASRGKQGYFRSFYARRTLRIFPLYYTYLALLALVLALTPAGHASLRSLGRAWPWYVLYLTNVKIVFFFDRDIGSVQHLWSLAIEEHFYLLWPAVVAVLPRRALAVFVCVAIAMICCGRYLWLANGADYLSIYMSSWTRADALLVGAGLAIARTHARSWRSMVKVAPAVLGVSLGGLFCVYGLPGSRQPADGLYAKTIGFTVLAVFFAALLVRCIARDERGTTPAVLRNRVVQRVGRLSYGIYVFHFFLVLALSPKLQMLLGRGLAAFAAQLMVIGLVSYGLAELSFRLVEGPALRLKRYFPRPT
jgi:peptidoglycan/LPS O-acetylase OafA/YrhL